ncbi:ATP-binding protein [Lactococcus sp.]|uniref:HAMP domain-containing sensor histidine kinase n=1 Tax=Lactococcus sp. TaxID=44273 RepID=UPI0035B11944
MNKKRVKQEKQRTNASYLTRIFVRIFLVITILNVGIVAGVVTISGLRVRESEGAALISSVQEAAVNGNINWKEFEQAHDEGRWSDFIRVTWTSGKVDESHGTSEFIKGIEKIHLDNFYLSDKGVYWHDKLKTDKVTVELWLSVEEVIESVLQTIFAIIVVMFVSLAAGIYVIRSFAKKLSRPLAELSEAAANNNGKPLPVPENPVEINQLAKNFNQLLNRLNLKILQEQQFVSDASHELRTPVAAIRGHATLLKRRWKEHPEIIDESLDYIDEESQRMKVMIEELLTISRGNHMKIEKEKINLSDYIVQLISEIQPAITQDITLSVTENLFVSADKQALRHILAAFIENAGKYSPTDEKITVKLKKAGESVDLSVADKGLGIAKDEKEKVFERFYRVDKSRSSEIPGTGLGLSIAKQYAEMMDAWIFISDNVPNGSIFHLVLSEEE